MGGESFWWPNLADFGCRRKPQYSKETYTATESLSFLKWLWLQQHKSYPKERWYRDCAVPHVRHFSIFHCESMKYDLMLHWITLEYAVSQMKCLTYVRDCIIFVLSKLAITFSHYYLKGKYVRKWCQLMKCFAPVNIKTELVVHCMFNL